MLLDHIKQSSDIKKLKEDQYPELAREIRQFLIENSKTGGHLLQTSGCGTYDGAASGVRPSQRINSLFGMGHQAHTHKLLREESLF